VSKKGCWNKKSLQKDITSFLCAAEFLPQRTIAIWRWDIISMHLPKATYLHPFKVEATNIRQHDIARNWISPIGVVDHTWLDWSHKKNENKTWCLVFLFAVHGRKKKNQSKAKE